MINDKVEPTKVHTIKEAVEVCKSLPDLKFNETVDISINLGVDPKKSDQNVRGSSSLPHGIGKISKVAVFADGTEANSAKKAGVKRYIFNSTCSVYGFNKKKGF